MDDDLYKNLLKLKQSIYKQVADPDGICNEPQGHCFKCSLTNKCQIKFKKLKGELSE